MIRIKYECDETGQEMNIVMALGKTDENGEASVEVNVNFNPTVNDATKDPFNIMMRVLKAATKS